MAVQINLVRSRQPDKNNRLIKNEGNTNKKGISLKYKLGCTGKISPIKRQTLAGYYAVGAQHIRTQTECE